MTAPSPSPSPRPARRALLVLLLASLVLVALVMRPLVEALFLGGVLAAALAPTHARLARALRGRPQLAAGVLLTVMVLAVLGPLVGLAAFVVREAVEAAGYVNTTLQSQGLEGLLRDLPDAIERLARAALARVPLQDVGQDLQRQLAARGGVAASALGTAVSRTGALAFHTVMMLIAMFFFLTEQERALRFVDEASPLGHAQTRELMGEFRGVTVAVVRSTVLTALVQALAALAGYLIVRAPHPVFFTVVTFFVAMVPAVGAASVCLLVAALLLLGGHPIAAAVLAGWGVIVVGLSDNVVKPLLIRGDVPLHGAVVFFALLGGLAAFGAIGLLLGPLAVALFVAVLRMYQRDYGTPGEERAAGPTRDASHSTTRTD